MGMGVSSSTQDTQVDLLEAQLPDILAISSAEVTLPTLNMNSSELNELSLSGIINTIGISPDAAMQVVQVDSNTIQGQNQPITFHLQAMEEQLGPVRDVRDNIQGFAQAGTNTANPAYQEFQNLLSNKVTPVEQKPFVRILEQPASHKLRFRYKCEGRGAGALQGERSSPDKKTFPKIQIVGYKGPAVVVVSCVTHDAEVPKTHPHNLVSPASVGRDGCKKGVCTMNVNNEEMSVEFPHLGIQCVRRRDIADALKQRQEIRVDPFRQGFGHVDSPNSIDLNAVKLCFQVFLENPKTPGKYTVILDPVCSKPIFDAKAKKELQIMDMSDNTAPADGGKKVIILCEKVSKEDIKVRFYDFNGWEEWADFGAADVHKQYAISFKVPRYQNIDIAEPVKVCVELVKPSDDTRSEEEEFFFTPVNEQVCKPPQMEAKMEVTPKFVHNGGGFVTEVKNELSEGGGAWKQMTSQAGPMTVKARLDPYSKVVLSEAGLGLSGLEYGQVPISGGYEYNIPVSNTVLSSSPYTMSQSSPDSQALADLNISSPGQSYQPEVSHSDLVKILGQEAAQDDEMQNLSDKLDEFSLGHGAPLNISPVPVNTSRVGGKRTSKEAENDSASILIPRQMERQQSSITTPNVSSNLSEILQNCKQINDL